VLAAAAPVPEDELCLLCLVAGSEHDERVFVTKGDARGAWVLTDDFLDGNPESQDIRKSHRSA